MVSVAGVPGRGRFLVLQLRLDAGRIVEAGYQCHGCGATIPVGSMLTEMIAGRTAGQKILKTAATEGFGVGDTVIIDDGAKTEVEIPNGTVRMEIVGVEDA